VVVSDRVTTHKAALLPETADIKLELDRAARLERDQRQRGGPMMARGERAWPR
jgi:hypothetical protein